MDNENQLRDDDYYDDEDEDILNDRFLTLKSVVKNML